MVFFPEIVLPYNFIAEFHRSVARGLWLGSLVALSRLHRQLFEPSCRVTKFPTPALFAQYSQARQVSGE